MRKNLILALFAAAMLATNPASAQDEHRSHNDPTRILRYKNLQKKIPISKITASHNKPLGVVSNKTTRNGSLTLIC